MYNALLHTHSGLRWVVLLLLIINILNAAKAMNGPGGLSAQAKKLSLFGLISAHVQFLIGLILYWMSPKVQFSSETMGNSMLRFFTMEHSVLMLLGIVLITLANRHAKTGQAKKMFWKLLIALIVILIGIPWPFRAALGSGWF